MRLLDSLMRTLAGVAGALLAAGGIYLLVVAAKTSGIGLAGSFFGFFGLAALATGIGLVIVAIRSLR
jgi:hypothetical protein